MNELKHFEKSLNKYHLTFDKIIQNRNGLNAQMFIEKAINAIKKEPDLLKCTEESLIGSVMYFAELGLPFNSPEGYGYISIEMIDGILEAKPIIGYKGLIEIAYRNQNLKSIRIQAVYEGDEFDFQYGTNEYIQHKPDFFNANPSRKLLGVYATATIEGMNPLFVVVHKVELDKLQKLSKPNSAKMKEFDVFNVMQSKVAIKLLFKMLPKTGNQQLLDLLEMDNKFDYERNVKIQATETGYELIEVQTKKDPLKEIALPKIEVIETQQMIEKQVEVVKETVDEWNERVSKQKGNETAIPITTSIEVKEPAKIYVESTTDVEIINLVTID
jgi:recombination protein RecT